MSKKPNIVTVVIHSDPDPRRRFSWFADVIDAARDFQWRRHGRGGQAPGE